MHLIAGASRNDAEGWIYFIRSGDRPLVKIGWAVDVRVRVAALQSGNPDPLEVITAVPGTQLVEREWHRLLAPHRVRGEWFAECPAVARALRRCSVITIAIAKRLGGVEPDEIDLIIARHKIRRGERRSATVHNRILTPALVRQIRKDRRSVRAIAASLGVSKTAVQDVKTGKTWGHVA
jgi:hypothetical protein